MEKDFEGWEPPKWHEDWGDPEVDISIFKELCYIILEVSSNFQFELDPVEEGYLSLNVLLHKKKVFDVQLVDRSAKRLGIFFENGEEVYLSSPNEIAEYVKDLPS